MAQNFTTNIPYKGKNLLATILPNLRKDGMYYEVNLPGYPRFHMRWTALDRYDISHQETLPELPYELVLAVSDVIEAHEK